MPELRHDLVSGRLVLVAPERAVRPHTSHAHRDRSEPGDDAGPVADCPFCPGHEARTPPEVLRTGGGAPDTPGWRVRVVPNLYPLVGGPHAGSGAAGAHEVVVLSPAHGTTFDLLERAAAAEVLTVLRDRARTHLARGCAHVQVILNQGREAGQSLSHPHAQLVALGFTPPAVVEAVGRNADRDLLAAELTALEGTGFVIADGDVAVWCPPAAAAPYEMRIAARDAGARFDEATDLQCASVAAALGGALDRLRRAADDPPYNVVVHTAGADGSASFHWFVSLVPRLAIVAGFEQGTGVFVNTVAPEHAAEHLRSGGS